MQKYQFVVDKIRELFNEQEKPIPLHAPVFNGNEKKYIEECIDTTFVSSVGIFVDRFETKLKEYTGVRKAVVCVNGTNALHLALKLVGVERDTEVITQPLTFIATANAIAYCDANPVFLDIDLNTLGLSPKTLLSFLEKSTYYKADTNQQINKFTNKPITACLPMHTFGHPCRIDEIVVICDSFHIPVVEDAAESLGSFYKGRHTGTFGKIGVLSFNGNKILTTGGGGMLLFMDEEMGERAKHLTTQAKIPHPWEFIHDAVGYNYRMPNINAALGLAQFEQLNDFLISKRDLADNYRHFFNQTDIEYVEQPENSLSNYWLNCILLPDKLERDLFLDFTNKNNVMTRPAWRLMNELPMFKKCQSVDLLNSINLADRIVNIPSSVRKPL